MDYTREIQRTWKYKSGRSSIVAYTRTLTCSTVRGELISSPRRIMDLCVSTSESWKASKPRRSLAMFSTNNKGGHALFSCMDPHHLWGNPSLQLCEEIPETPTRQVTKPSLAYAKAVSSHIQSKAGSAAVMGHSQTLI